MNTAHAIQALEESVVSPGPDSSTRAVATETVRPTRWRAPEKMEPWASRVKILLPLAHRDPAYLETIRAGYYEGDPLADAVIEWMHRTSLRSGWGLFDQALTKGIDSVENAPEELKAFFAAVDHIPSWVDLESVKRGCDFAVRNRRAERWANFTGLLSGYAVAGLTKPLMATGYLDTAARRRFVETTQFVHDVHTSKGMGRFSEGFFSTVRVRMLHAMVRHKLSKDGWDTDHWGIPINQVDMGTTLIVFSSANLMSQRIMGMIISRAEGQDYVNLWRYVGYLQGISDRYNPASEWEAWKIIPLIIGAQEGPDRDGSRLATALLNTCYEDWPKTWWGRLAAEGQIQFAVALSRVLWGEEIADGLGLPNSTFWKLVVASNTVGNWAQEALRLVLPGGNARAVEAGRRRFVNDMKRLAQGRRTNYAHHT